MTGKSVLPPIRHCQPINGPTKPLALSGSNDPAKGVADLLGKWLAYLNLFLTEMDKYGTTFYRHTGNRLYQPNSPGQQS